MQPERDEHADPVRIDLVSAALPPALDGIGDYTGRLAGTLAQDARVRVMVAHGQRPVAIKGVGIVPCFNTRTPWGLTGLAKAAANDPPDWLVLQFSQFSFGRYGFAPLLASTLARMRRDCPRLRLAVMFHETFVPPTSRRLRVMRTWQTRQFNQLGRLADVVLFSTGVWARRYARRFGIKPVVHLPVGANIERVGLTRQAARAALGLDVDRPTLVMFGNNVSDQALAIVGELRRRPPASGPMQVVYVGPCAVAVRAALPGPGVLAAGPLPATEVSRRMVAADVMLALYPDGASTRRGSLIAGLQHGLACISNRGINVDRLFLEAHDEALLLTAAEPPNVTAATVRRLLDDAEERHRLGQGAERLYVQHFSWQRIAEQLLHVMRTAPSPSDPAHGEHALCLHQSVTS